MNTFSVAPHYYHIDQLLDFIDEPAQGICRRLLSENRKLFQEARGSTHNHQTWDGGYIDHVNDGMNYGFHLYAFQSTLGRPMPFSLSDVLLIFFLHDIEKPWRIVVRASGEVANKDGLDTKALSKKFREKKLSEYGLVLSPAQQNALTYVEGEGDDYSSTCRIMNELAAFCHSVDVWSARQCYDYPKPSGEDEWVGAERFRATETFDLNTMSSRPLS